MRVIAGIAKGRKLKAPRGDSVRPTSDRVKEALFSILGNMISGSMFLDLYAGTGSIGIEALSRGCHKAFFIENDPRAIACLKHNINLTGFSDNGVIITSSVPTGLNLLARKKTMFDIIFLDPPYLYGFVEKEMRRAGQLLNEGGLLVLESGKNQDMEKDVGSLTLTREILYGDTKLSFYK